MQQTSPPRKSGKNRALRASRRCELLAGGRRCKNGVNSDETVVSPEDVADEFYRCLVLTEANDFRGFLPRVFHASMSEAAHDEDMD